MPGLYIHIPFCEKKCIYCDFYSIEKTSLMDEFLNAVCKEMDMVAGITKPACTFSSVFLGGGTPSLMTPAQLESLFAVLHRNYSIAADAEITMECNPGTIDSEKLCGYKSLGVNRLSFGVQSFHADELAFLGRIHNAEQAREGVALAKTAGFENINVDLMFALPMHTRERWEFTLQQACSLDVQHISAYSLIYEEGTPLYTQLQHKEVTPIDEELDAELSLFTSEFLCAHGYEQYEVSNFARPRSVRRNVNNVLAIAGNRSNENSINDAIYTCRHNMNYWQCGEYLSFGPSAHSYWKSERRWNISNLASYMNAVRDNTLPVGNQEKITQEQAMVEYISLGLRSNGISLRRFQELFSFDFFSRYAREISSFTDSGLLTPNGGDRIRCTPKGYLWCDTLTLAFLRDITIMHGN